MDEIEIRDHRQLLVAEFQALRPRLIAIAARIVGLSDAEDICQETFVRCYLTAGRHAIDKPRAFLIRSAVNQCLNHLQRAEYRLADDLGATAGLDSAAPSPEACYDSDARYLRFCHIVADLSPRCREAFLLRKVLGMSQRETASSLGVSEGTVEKHIAKAMHACGTALNRLDRYDRERGDSPQALAGR